MNLLDLVVIVLLVSGIAAGYGRGLVAHLASWAGLAAGFLLALAVLPTIAETFSTLSSVTLLGLSLFVLFLGASVGSGLGATVGRRLRRAIPGRARGFDRVGGSAAGAVGVLVLLWLLVPVMAEVPGSVARQSRTSVIAELVTNIAPSPPEPTVTLRELIDKADFPQVFADLRPTPDAGPPPAEVPVSPEVVERAVASTVNVESRGCGRTQEGSGFAVGTDLVMTNAHVVAGSETLEVVRPDGSRLPGRVVGFDGDRDLALLRVPGLQQEPFAVLDAGPGTEGAIIGHPGGQDRPRIAPAVVRSVRPTVGLDIYHDNRVRREVLFLAATLAPGDSGAPVIDARGQVVGVVFAVAPDRPATAFALAADEVDAFLTAPRDEDAGPCMH